MSKVFVLSVKIAKWQGFKETDSQTWLRAEKMVTALKKKIPFRELGEMAHVKPSQVVGDQYSIPVGQASQRNVACASDLDHSWD
jgi:hypothetical protein